MCSASIANTSSHYKLLPPFWDIVQMFNAQFVLCRWQCEVNPPNCNKHLQICNCKEALNSAHHENNSMFDDAMERDAMEADVASMTLQRTASVHVARSCAAFILLIKLCKCSKTLGQIPRFLANPPELAGKSYILFPHNTQRKGLRMRIMPHI